jgi:hypothetical protein
VFPLSRMCELPICSHHICVRITARLCEPFVVPWFSLMACGPAQLFKRAIRQGEEREALYIITTCALYSVTFALHHQHVFVYVHTLAPMSLGYLFLE